MRNFQKTDGFTLLELLIVAALIGILAAIATPGLMRSRLSGQEANAISSMRAVLSAESTFASSCGSGFFAPTLTLLSTPPVGGGEGFVGTDLATDPSLKAGFRFTMTGGVPSAGAPASCNGAAAGTLSGTYFLAADPVSSGDRHFGANQGATIYESGAVVVVTQTGAPAGATPIQ